MKGMMIMLPTLFILLFAVIICIIEVPRLRKKQRHKELYVFSFLLFIGVGLSVLTAMQIKIPNPLDIIAFIYRPVSILIYGKN